MSEKRNIARAAGILGSATILSRIMGMVRDMVVSRLFGAGLATDAFFAAFQIPNMLRRFFQDYKQLEGKSVEVDEIQAATKAYPIILDALHRYSEQRRKGFGGPKE